MKLKAKYSYPITIRSFYIADIKPKVLETPNTISPISYNANGDEMTLNELLSTEKCVTNNTSSHLRVPGSVDESQHFQRQNCSLSVRKINRPASVPSTKKFDECGVSIGKTIKIEEPLKCIIILKNVI